MDNLKVEAALGPGRIGKFDIQDVREVTFDLAHRVVSAIDKNGRRHEFDLGSVKGIRAANPGGNLTIELRPTP